MLDLSNLGKEIEQKKEEQVKKEPYIRVKSQKHKQFIIGLDSSVTDAERKGGLVGIAVYDKFSRRIVCQAKSRRKTFDELVRFVEKDYKNRIVTKTYI